MKRTILTLPDLAGAALADCKRWLAITTAAEDTSLTTLLGASAEACEAFTGVLPLETACEEVLPARREWQALATRPVQAILGVEGIPAEGPRFPLAADAYEVELNADGTGQIRLLRQGAAGRIAVRFAAGLAPDWDTLPDGLRHGVVRLAAELYRARDGGRATALPAAVTALWRPWRRMRLT